MHVLVIGGTRFVGPLLVHRLLAAGHQVTLFNRGTMPDPFGARIERLQGDRTTADLPRLMQNRHFDAAVDFAAYRWEDTRGAVEALGGRVGHYLFISTGQVYLVREGFPKPARETDYAGPLIPRPTDEDELANFEYGTGKRDCEDALVEAFEKSRFPSTRIRIPIVNGERDHYRRLDRYLYRLVDGGPVIVPDGGTHLVRHVYAGEVARFLTEILGREQTFGDAYNVCQQETPSLVELLGLLQGMLGSRAKLVPVASADLLAAGLSLRETSPFSSKWMSMLDPSKVEAELGFRHEPLAVSLGKIVASFLAYGYATPPDGYDQRPKEIELAERWLKERETVRPPPSMRFD
jgi:nucleoside-diphosphate-sugar epimerase